MHLDNLLLPRQSGGCVVCPNPAPCNCAANEACIQINRDCNTCSSFKCAPTGSSNSGSSSGVSSGALAGAIIGALILLALALTLFLWYRRLQRNRRQNAEMESKKDIPAPAETVLNRPNPTEKPSPAQQLNTYSHSQAHSSDATIGVEHPRRASTHAGSYNTLGGSSYANPFEDSTSIQTAGTEGTNVIPIALVPPGSDSAISSETSPSMASPIRPARTPELNLNLDHVNVSRESLQPYSQSQISGVSGRTSRNSYMSNASYSSDFLHEAPMIITPTKGAVRQVVGVVKAEVIQAPGSIPSSPSASDSLRVSSLSSRPSARSPLAARSFGPADIIPENEEGQEVSIQSNPFGDENTSLHSHLTTTISSPAGSTTTFGASSLQVTETGSNNEWAMAEPNQPWTATAASRPSSVSTQSGSIVDIGSATRVNVGLGTLGTGYATYAMASSPLSANSFPKSPYRTTMGRLVSPVAATSTGTLEEQQQRALAHAQARAKAQGLSRRISGSSVLSSVSTRADSILEAFPFVPPSPISDRPIRSPPCSPLTKQSFNEQLTGRETSEASPSSTPTPPPPTPKVIQPDVPKPTNRRTLGLSVGSQISTASSGLGSFPFHIDSGSGGDAVGPPSSFKDRPRASLDTLALTSDLSSYPLGFDRDTRESFTAFHKR